MTKQEREETIKEFGYPPHMPCGECPAWDAYWNAVDAHDEQQKSQVIYYCQRNCEYYKEMCGGKRE